MSKKSRELRSNMFEGDVDELEPLQTTIKTKHISKNMRVSNKTTDKCTSIERSFSESPISERVVPCKCNKCGNNVNGVMINYIYSVLSDNGGLCIPFINYECKSCGHLGKRSVMSKALNSYDFFKYYF